MCNKKGKGSNIDSWGIPQFMVPCSEKAVPNKTKKAVFVR